MGSQPGGPSEGPESEAATSLGSDSPLTAAAGEAADPGGDHRGDRAQELLWCLSPRPGSAKRRKCLTLIAGGARIENR